MKYFDSKENFIQNNSPKIPSSTEMNIKTGSNYCHREEGSRFS